MTLNIFSDNKLGSRANPPGAWKPLRRWAQVLTAPVERFLHIQASSGIILMLAAAVALIWANSQWSHLYHSLWHTPLGFRLGNLSFERDLHFWINDGLMAIFFFVIGLEIRREIHQGELSEMRRAALPLFAALGGMVVPAGVFIMLNQGLVTAQGWGIPMATDIAFAVGVMALLGKRISPALRIFLLTLAVVDDIGAILIIAIFYSAELSTLGFALAAIGILFIFLMQKLGIRSPWAYLAPALITWGGTYAAGIHPTIAGVVVGLMTPVRAWLETDQFLDIAETKVHKIRHMKNRDEAALLPHLSQLNTARKEAVSPVERIQQGLHGWVAFIIMPLFALANAGVPFGEASLANDGFNVFWGVMFGLILGKPVGVFLFSWLAVQLKIARLPTGVKWRGIFFVGLCAGIGFTMAIFIAQLAFTSGQTLETAKLAILCASGLAAGLAFATGLILLKPELADGAARTESEAEASADK
ncbi:MAG TPA: Na+/H+ antiporter NhaA [Oligoflexus sp.]|uniref:Na+/H+ antiporter NhaA n=1 Tax=Oligoflexus sp. TaxID=1971216 RepID=UPI002D403B4D|nr:Na+/H+ antiporter NhaA [Oligoflexus sp.]HYX32262.1 Na+/H+ antiporter NhaA [Oligoflexus sp.]